MNNINTYSELVKTCAKSGDEILKTVSGRDAHLMHMLLLLAGEVGELIDPIKKTIIYNKQEFDKKNIVEELGDIEFALEGIRQSLGISREKVLEENINKLSKRYKEGYSDKAAQTRADKTE